MNKIRTFIAVQASERVNNNLGRVIERLDSTGADYKWVAPENLHLTLYFLGDLPDRGIPDFCKEVKKAVEHHRPFEMSLLGVGAFPDMEQPRTIWIGVDQGSQELGDLYRDLGSVCRDWCSGRDRNEFTPHLTLGRLGRDGRWNEGLLEELHRLRSHPTGSCQVDRVTVYSSFLERSGPTYAAMATIKLKGQPGERTQN
jgi:RNA 2',3'-cyclic 3'-phosphodiesterase